MRLIDADRLETHEQLEPFGNGKYEYSEVVYKDDIDDAPTVDKDCQRKKRCPIFWMSESPDDDGYCFLGERGEADDN